MSEEIEVRGHIVDSLLLPKILDRILLMGGSFEIRECKIGVHRADPSYARIAIRAESQETLDAILGDLVDTAPRRFIPKTPRPSPPISPARFPKGFTARPTSRPRSA